MADTGISNVVATSPELHRGVTGSDVLKFYQETRRHYGTYHNHKEICAWAALVVHLAVCCALVKDLGPWGWAFALFLSLETVLVLFYMDQQFEGKNAGSDFYAGATQVEVAILCGEISLEEAVKFSPAHPIRRESALHVYDHAPDKLLEKVKAVKTGGNYLATVTRWCAFFIVLVSFITVATVLIASVP